MKLHADGQKLLQVWFRRSGAIPCFREFSSEFFHFFAKTGKFCPEFVFFRFLQGIVQGIAGKATLSVTIAGAYGECFGQPTLWSREFAGKMLSQIGTIAARRAKAECDEGWLDRRLCF